MWGPGVSLQFRYFRPETLQLLYLLNNINCIIYKGRGILTCRWKTNLYLCFEPGFVPLLRSRPRPRRRVLKRKNTIFSSKSVFKYYYILNTTIGINAMSFICKLYVKYSIYLIWLLSGINYTIPFDHALC